MFYRRNWIAVTVVISGLGMFIPSAQGQRQDFEVICCVSATQYVLHASQEITILAMDAKGILYSTHESKLFDNWTYETWQVIKGHEGKWSWNGFGKMLSPDGEFILVEFSGPREGITTVKSIFGTGKYKGAKLEIQTKRITSGKPIAPGTAQSCDKKVGWLELSK